MSASTRLPQLEVPSSPEPAPSPIVPDAPSTPAVPDPGPAVPDLPSGPTAPEPVDPLPADPAGPNVTLPDTAGLTPA